MRGLAERLKVTKPVITRALDAMGRQGLLRRRRDENDRRNVLVQRTLKGALFIERLGDTIAARAGESRRAYFGADTVTLIERALGVLAAGG